MPRFIMCHYCPRTTTQRTKRAIADGWILHRRDPDVWTCPECAKAKP